MGQEGRQRPIPFLHRPSRNEITQGRRKEFAAFREYSGSSIRRRISDPPARKTSGFGGCGEAAVEPETREVKFRGAETLLLQKEN